MRAALHHCGYPGDMIHLDPSKCDINIQSKHNHREKGMTLNRQDLTANELWIIEQITSGHSPFLEQCLFGDLARKEYKEDLVNAYRNLAKHNLIRRDAAGIYVLIEQENDSDKKWYISFPDDGQRKKKYFATLFEAIEFSQGLQNFHISHR